MSSYYQSILGLSTINGDDLYIDNINCKAFNLSDGSEGDGFVLTSDGDGQATWKPDPNTLLSGDTSGPLLTNTVDFVGGSTAIDIHTAEILANTSTSSNTPNTIVRRDGGGNFDGNASTCTLATNVINGIYSTDTGTVTNTMLAGGIASNKLANTAVASLSGVNTGDQTNVTGSSGSCTGNSATATIANTVITNANLTGEVTSIGNSTTIGNSAVIGKVLTGFTSGAGTVTGSDTILQAFQKLNGNIVAGPGNLSGDISSVGLVTTAGPSIVKTTVSQALSNKTFANNTCSFVDATDPTKKIVFQSSGATTGTTATIVSPITANSTYLLPNSGLGSTLIVDNYGQTIYFKTIQNSSMIGSTNNVDANSLRNGSTYVVPLGGSAPSAGQALTYNGSSAQWGGPIVCGDLTSTNNIFASGSIGCGLQTTPLVRGGYIGWNRPGSFSVGSMCFSTNFGSGVGGFEFMNYNLSGVATPSVSLLNIGPTGIISPLAGVTLPSSGGTPSLLNYYEEYTHATQWVGQGTTLPSSNIFFTRIGRIVTAMVTQQFNQPTSSNSTNYTMNNTIPSRFRPSITLWHNIAGIVNGVDSILCVGAGSTMSIYVGPYQNGPQWPATSAVNGWVAFTMTWSA